MSFKRPAVSVIVRRVKFGSTEVKVNSRGAEPATPVDYSGHDIADSRVDVHQAVGNDASILARRAAVNSFWSLPESPINAEISQTGVTLTVNVKREHAD